MKTEIYKVGQTYNDKYCDCMMKIVAVDSDNITYLDIELNKVVKVQRDFFLQYAELIK